MLPDSRCRLPHRADTRVGPYERIPEWNERAHDIKHVPTPINSQPVPQWLAPALAPGKPVTVGVTAIVTIVGAEP